MITVFKRYELKYMMDEDAVGRILPTLLSHIVPDAYPESTVQSLYYDTDTDLLIRNSIEKPLYKEKLRLRAYGVLAPGKDAFLELKKKSEHVVFKRRILITEEATNAFLCGQRPLPRGQIASEIEAFCRFYPPLSPKMLLLYDRRAYAEPGTDLRITFDRRIRYRTDRLSLSEGLDGTLLLPEGRVLMEIKTGTAYPLWLARLLSDEGIYKQSFSKYGTAYCVEYQKRMETSAKESTREVLVI